MKSCSTKVIKKLNDSCIMFIYCINMYTKSQGQFKTALIHSSYDGFSKLPDS